MVNLYGWTHIYVDGYTSIWMDTHLYGHTSIRAHIYMDGHTSEVVNLYGWTCITLVITNHSDNVYYLSIPLLVSHADAPLILHTCSSYKALLRISLWIRGSGPLYWGKNARTGPVHAFCSVFIWQNRMYCSVHKGSLLNKCHEMFDTCLHPVTDLKVKFVTIFCESCGRLRTL